MKIIFHTLFLCFTLAMGCTNTESRKELLPECNIAYNAYNIPLSELLQNGRPKVVTNNNMLAGCISKETLFNDVELLKKQIAKYPEFDFIFYFTTATDNVQQIAAIANECDLNIVAIVDAKGEFRQKNELSDKMILSTLIFDKELKPHFSTIPGTRLSPFDSVIKKFINNSLKE